MQELKASTLATAHLGGYGPGHCTKAAGIVTSSSFVLRPALRGRGIQVSGLSSESNRFTTTDAAHTQSVSTVIHEPVLDNEDTPVAPHHLIPAQNNRENDFTLNPCGPQENHAPQSDQPDQPPGSTQSQAVAVLSSEIQKASCQTSTVTVHHQATDLSDHHHIKDADHYHQTSVDEVHTAKAVLGLCTDPASVNTAQHDMDNTQHVAAQNVATPAPSHTVHDTSSYQYSSVDRSTTHAAGSGTSIGDDDGSAIKVTDDDARTVESGEGTLKSLRVLQNAMDSIPSQTELSQNVAASDATSGTAPMDGDSGTSPHMEVMDHRSDSQAHADPGEAANVKSEENVISQTCEIRSLSSNSRPLSRKAATRQPSHKGVGYQSSGLLDKAVTLLHRTELASSPQELLSCVKAIDAFDDRAFELRQLLWQAAYRKAAVVFMASDPDEEGESSRSSMTGSQDSEEDESRISDPSVASKGAAHDTSISIGSSHAGMSVEKGVEHQLIQLLNNRAAHAIRMGMTTMQLARVIDYLAVVGDKPSPDVVQEIDAALLEAISSIPSTQRFAQHKIASVFHATYKEVHPLMHALLRAKKCGMPLPRSFSVVWKSAKAIPKFDATRVFGESEAEIEASNDDPVEVPIDIIHWIAPEGKSERSPAGLLRTIWLSNDITTLLAAVTAVEAHSHKMDAPIREILYYELLCKIQTMLGTSKSLAVIVFSDTDVHKLVWALRALVPKFLDLCSLPQYLYTCLGITFCVYPIMNWRVLDERPLTRMLYSWYGKQSAAHNSTDTSQADSANTSADSSSSSGGTTRTQFSFYEIQTEATLRDARVLFIRYARCYKAGILRNAAAKPLIRYIMKHPCFDPTGAHAGVASSIRKMGPQVGISDKEVSRMYHTSTTKAYPYAISSTSTADPEDIQSDDSDSNTQCDSNSSIDCSSPLVLSEDTVSSVDTPVDCDDAGTEHIHVMAVPSSAVMSVAAAGSSQAVVESDSSDDETHLSGIVHSDASEASTLALGLKHQQSDSEDFSSSFGGDDDNTARAFGYIETLRDPRSVTIQDLRQIMQGVDVQALPKPVYTALWTKVVRVARRRFGSVKQAQSIMNSDQREHAGVVIDTLYRELPAYLPAVESLRQLGEVLLVCAITSGCGAHVTFPQVASTALLSKLEEFATSSSLAADNSGMMGVIGPMVTLTRNGLLQVTVPDSFAERCMKVCADGKQVEVMSNTLSKLGYAKLKGAEAVVPTTQSTNTQYQNSAAESDAVNGPMASSTGAPNGEDASQRLALTFQRMIKFSTEFKDLASVVKMLASNSAANSNEPVRVSKEAANSLWQSLYAQASRMLGTESNIKRLIYSDEGGAVRELLRGLQDQVAPFLRNTQNTISDTILIMTFLATTGNATAYRMPDEVKLVLEKNLQTIDRCLGITRQEHFNLIAGVWALRKRNIATLQVPQGLVKYAMKMGSGQKTKDEVLGLLRKLGYETDEEPEVSSSTERPDAAASTEAGPGSAIQRSPGFTYASRTFDARPASRSVSTSSKDTNGSSSKSDIMQGASTRESSSSSSSGSDSVDGAGCVPNFTQLAEQHTTASQRRRYVQQVISQHGAATPPDVLAVLGSLMATRAAVAAADDMKRCQDDGRSGAVVTITSGPLAKLWDVTRWQRCLDSSGAAKAVTTRSQDQRDMLAELDSMLELLGDPLLDTFPTAAMATLLVLLQLPGSWAQVTAEVPTTDVWLAQLVDTIKSCAVFGPNGLPVENKHPFLDLLERHRLVPSLIIGLQALNNRSALEDVGSNDLLSMWVTLADHATHNMDRQAWSVQGTTRDSVMRVLLQHVTTAETEESIASLIGAYMEAEAESLRHEADTMGTNMQCAVVKAVIGLCPDTPSAAVNNFIRSTLAGQPWEDVSMLLQQLDTQHRPGPQALHPSSPFRGVAAHVAEALVSSDEDLGRLQACAQVTFASLTNPHLRLALLAAALEDEGMGHTQAIIVNALQQQLEQERDSHHLLAILSSSKALNQPLIVKTIHNMALNVVPLLSKEHVANMLRSDHVRCELQAGCTRMNSLLYVMVQGMSNYAASASLQELCLVVNSLAVASDLKDYVTGSSRLNMEKFDPLLSKVCDHISGQVQSGHELTMKTVVTLADELYTLRYFHGPLLKALCTNMFRLLSSHDIDRHGQQRLLSAVTKACAHLAALQTTDAEEKEVFKQAFQMAAEYVYVCLEFLDERSLRAFAMAFSFTNLGHLQVGGDTGLFNAADNYNAGVHSSDQQTQLYIEPIQNVKGYQQQDGEDDAACSDEDALTLQGLLGDQDTIRSHSILVSGEILDVELETSIASSYQSQNDDCMVLDGAKQASQDMNRSVHNSGVKKAGHEAQSSGVDLDKHSSGVQQAESNDSIATEQPSTASAFISEGSEWLQAMLLDIQTESLGQPRETASQYSSAPEQHYTDIDEDINTEGLRADRQEALTGPSIEDADIAVVASTSSSSTLQGAAVSSKDSSDSHQGTSAELASHDQATVHCSTSVKVQGEVYHTRNQEEGVVVASSSSVQNHQKESSQEGQGSGSPHVTNATRSVAEVIVEEMNRRRGHSVLQYMQEWCVIVRRWQVLMSLQVPDDLVDALDSAVKLTARPSFATRRLLEILHENRTEIGIRNVATEVHVGFEMYVDVVGDYKDGQRIYIEVDGPVHFTNNHPYRQDGSTVIRDACLRKLIGNRLVTLNISDMPKLQSQQAEDLADIVKMIKESISSQLQAQ